MEMLPKDYRSNEIMNTVALVCYDHFAMKCLLFSLHLLHSILSLRFDRSGSSSTTAYSRACYFYGVCQDNQQSFNLLPPPMTIFRE